MKNAKCISVYVLIFSCLSMLPAIAAEQNVYVGTEACKSCHTEIYERFQKIAHKAHSFASVERMAPQLTEEEIKTCYGCHTTGYGKEGGFVSKEKTPGLANCGCESCHGPGGAHVESEGDPAAIVGKGKIVMEKQCLSCHDERRVGAFNYKPVLHAGAH